MSHDEENIHEDILSDGEDLNDDVLPDDATAGCGFDDDQDSEPVRSIDDHSDDAEALASAGHGTDEDYGYFGSGEE